jgi:hypothetical protein
MARSLFIVGIANGQCLPPRRLAVHPDIATGNFDSPEVSNLAIHELWRDLGHELARRKGEV